MTARNVERTGNRNDLALSTALRRIPNVRHQDVDNTQYFGYFNTKTRKWDYQVEICFESTSSREFSPEHKTLLTREKFARPNKAWTALTIHAYGDDGAEKNLVEVYLWEPDGTPNDIYGETMEWEVFTDLCSQIHDIYDAEIYSKSNKLTKKDKI